MLQIEVADRVSALIGASQTNRQIDNNNDGSKNETKTGENGQNE